VLELWVIKHAELSLIILALVISFNAHFCFCVIGSRYFFVQWVQLLATSELDCGLIARVAQPSVILATSAAFGYPWYMFA